MSTRFPGGSNRVVSDPAWLETLLSNRRAGWLWLLPRLWVGKQWIDAGWHKFGDPDWVQTGIALQKYWERAVSIPEAPARPAVAFDWYRSFLQALLDAQAYTWFAKLVTAGELLVGIALVLGAFTGLAAFFGAVLNWNFMMAGSASTNPVLFVLAVLLILAWKVSGYVGLDYFLLPRLGTPWKAKPVGSEAAGG